MLAIKRQSVDCEKKRQETEKQIQQEKQNQMVAVKKQEILGTFKRKAYFEDKLTRVKNHQVKKMEEEEVIQVGKEMEILNLEKMERELVERIQKTKSVQKQVYKDLEKILTSPPSENATEFFKQIASPTEGEHISTGTKSLGGSLFDREENGSVQSQLVQSQLIQSFKNQEGLLPLPASKRL